MLQGSNHLKRKVSTTVWHQEMDTNIFTFGNNKEQEAVSKATASAMTSVGWGAPPSHTPCDETGTFWSRCHTGTLVSVTWCSCSEETSHRECGNCRYFSSRKYTKLLRTEPNAKTRARFLDPGARFLLFFFKYDKLPRVQSTMAN